MKVKKADIQIDGAEIIIIPYWHKDCPGAMEELENHAIRSLGYLIAKTIMKYPERKLIPIIRAFYFKQNIVSGNIKVVDITEDAFKRILESGTEYIRLTKQYIAHFLEVVEDESKEVDKLQIKVDKCRECAFGAVLEHENDILICLIDGAFVSGTSYCRMPVLDHKIMAAKGINPAMMFNKVFRKNEDMVRQALDLMKNHNMEAAEAMKTVKILRGKDEE